MDEPQQAEYLEEIADLRARLAKLEQDQADPTLIEEYATEVRLLEALLLAARELRDQLRTRPELAEKMSLHGFVATRFQDIYAFVYDRAIEIDLAGMDLARAVDQTNFAELLAD